MGRAVTGCRDREYRQDRARQRFAMFWLNVVGFACGCGLLLMCAAALVKLWWWG